MDDRIETSSVPSEEPSRHHRRRRRHGFLAGLVLGALGAGLVGFAVGATMPAAEAAFGAYERVRERGGEPGHGLRGGPPSPEEMADRAEFFVAFALHRLDATDEQEDRVLDLVEGAVEQAAPMIERHHGNREALRTLLTASTIDRAALEKLRAEEVALVDSLSKTLLAAVADSAEVLTAEQRGELAERLARFHPHH